MYLLDANTYIQAKNIYYQLDFCPAYWHFLDQQFKTGILASIENVYDEIGPAGDELADWAKQRRPHFYPTATGPIQQKFKEVVQHIVALPNKSQLSVNAFLSGADPWLVATAALSGATIVTQEVPVPNESRKVKIPNICRDFNIAFMDTFSLLKELQARFVLS